MYKIYFDGSKKGQLIGYSAVIYYGDEIIYKSSHKLQNHKISSNCAEYLGIIHGLTLASAMEIKNIVVYGDCQLVIKQICGKYKAQSPYLKKLRNLVKTLETNFDSIEYVWVPREQNVVAHRECK